MSDTTASVTGNADGATASAANTGAGLAGSTAPIQNTPAPSWLEGADELTVGYVQNKGWTEPRQVLDGYRNLEKLLGADKAGNAVVMPKEGATPEEMSAFFNRLGRPEGADGYKMSVPEGSDGEFAKSVAAKFHELGLTKAQGEALSSWYNEQGVASVEAQKAAAQADFQNQDAALRQEWGAAFDQNLSAAKKAVQGLGLDAAAIDKIAGSLGHKATMELFSKIGGKVLEDGFVSGDRNTSFSNAMTPAQAKAEIKSLQDDKTFVKQYLDKNKDAVEKMSRLMSFAYPAE